MSPLETAIISKLCKYIDGVITLKQFSEWFVPTTWTEGIEPIGPTTIPKEERASKLVYSIKTRFGQYSDNLITKEELRERLIDLVL